MQKTFRLFSVLILLLGSYNSFSQDLSNELDAELKRIKNETKRSFIRPSVISNAGLIYHTEPPTVRFKAKHTGSKLILDHRKWELTVLGDAPVFILESRANEKNWKIILGEKGQTGWKQSGDTDICHISGQKITQLAEGWQIDFKVNNIPASIGLKVLTDEIIKLEISGDQLGKQASLEILCEADGPFYGGGERFTGCKLNGKVIDNHPYDTKRDFPWYPLPPLDSLETWQYIITYIPTPFVFSPDGLGLYMDDACSKQLDFTLADQGSFSINSYGPSTDIYLLAGDDPKAIIKAYTFITGRPEVLPPWGYGVWANLLEGKDKVLKEASFIRKKNIPVSAIWIFDQENPLSNTGWTHWTEGYYGRDANLMNDSLHSMGFKSLSYLRPSVSKYLSSYRMDNPKYHEGIQRKIFLDKAEVTDSRPIVDFLTSEALDMWSGFLKEAYLSDHYDGYMEDFGDILYKENKFRPPLYEHYDEQPDITKSEYNNIYPLLYHKFSHMIAKEYDPDYISFSRSGAPGSQSYSRMIWAGDQWPTFDTISGYPTTICAGITAGFSGYSNWSTDILSHSPSRELWIRWVEFSSLVPLMRDHLWEKLPSSIRFLTDEKTVEHFGKYARLHTSLFPYFYTLAHEAHETGIPIMRHTLLECPDEPQGYHNERCYFLGDRIFVAPVIEDGARTRSFYLPEGEWVNYWTGKVIKGGTKLTVDAPLGEIPLFVRNGSVIPLLSCDTQTLAADLRGKTIQDMTSHIELRIFGIPGRSGNLYELFDGTKIRAVNDGTTLKVQIINTSPNRNYSVVWPECELNKELEINEIL